MIIVELSFPVRANAIPVDNGYEIYAAISRTLDSHLPDGISISSIGGPYSAQRRILTSPTTCLRIRTPSDHIGDLLPLAGRFLNISGHEIGLGIPQVRALRPAPELTSRLVTIKGFTEPVAFLEAVNRQLAKLGVSGRATIPAFEEGKRKGELRRRVIRIKNQTIVGYSLTVSGLSAGDSYQLLARGIGGRRHMGCGIFVPVSRTEVRRGI
jgi:CRISPR-associated protein Cas6